MADAVQLNVRLPLEVRQALLRLARAEGVSLPELLSRLVRLAEASAPHRGGQAFLGWLEAVLRQAPPEDGGQVPADGAKLDRQARGRLGLLVRRQQEAARALAELEARRKAEEQVVATLQAQARQLAAAVREARQALSVLDVAKPTAHLAVLIAGLLDGRLPGVLSQEALRLLVGVALLGCRRSGLNPMIQPPEAIRKAHSTPPALDLESLLTWSLTALAPPGASRPTGSQSSRDGIQSRY